MENNQNSTMRINWLLADTVKFDHSDIEQLKSIGPFWGGVQTWRHCQTDNVVCYDLSAAQNFIKRNYQNKCNFYIPNDLYQSLDRPQNVKLFGGKFNLETDCKSEIICMHLLTGISDIVLIKGLDLTTYKSTEDKLKNHRRHNYKNLVRQVVMDNPTIQWVLLDHDKEVDKDLKQFDNLTVDSLSNVVKLLLR